MHGLACTWVRVIVIDLVSGHENRVTLFDDTNAVSFLFTYSICEDVQLLIVLNSKK